MLDGGFLEPRVAALENRMSLMGSDLHAVQIAGVGIGGMIDSLSPATNKGQDIYGSGGEKFRHRWQVTLETVTADNGSTSYTLHIRPGSLWRDEGAGAVELNVSPDGSTVTNGDGGWFVTNATTGHLCVVDDSAASIANPYRVIFSDLSTETRRILLRVADFYLDEHGAVLVQRQIGDALTSGASGLQLGPLTYETDGSTKRFVRYMGTWVYSETADAWTFAKAVKADGLPYPAAETLAAREFLLRQNGTIYVAYRPDIGPAPTKWMSRVTIRVSQGIDINPPQSDTDTGSVSETMRDLTYFTDNTVANASTDYPLTVQVAEANEATAYDS